VKQKKRKPQFSPNPNEDPTSSQEASDDDMGNLVPPPPPPPAPLEGLRSPTKPFTYTELEDMHNKIVQKCAPLIDLACLIFMRYEVYYVEQKLEEIQSLLKKIMTVTISMSSSPKKLISRSRQRVMMM
jgi:hypothetical protein